MSLIRRDNKEWFDFLDNFFNRNPFKSLRDDFETLFPRETFCCATEEGDKHIELEVPGFNESNIDVEVANGVLTVKGKRENVCCAGLKEIHKHYTIGVYDNVDASIKDGILRIVLKTSKKDVKKVELKTE